MLIWLVSLQLGKELERLELLKRQNLKRFIEATRTELEKVWGKCHYGEEQKQEFAPAFTGYSCQINYTSNDNFNVR